MRVSHLAVLAIDLTIVAYQGVHQVSVFAAGFSRCLAVRPVAVLLHGR